MYQPDELKSDIPGPSSFGGSRPSDIWRMLSAAAAGDQPVVEALVRADPHLATACHEYRPPLHFAAREGHLAVARFLLDHGADATDVSGLGCFASPLALAKHHGHTAMVELLANHLAQKHGIVPRGNDMATAIKARDFSKIQALLREDASLIQAADNRGNQPIHWAVMTRNPALIDFFLAQGANINAMRPDGARPVELTNGDYFYRGWRDAPREAVANHWVILGHLLAHGAEYDLVTAAKIGDSARCIELLNADPAIVNQLPPYITYYSGFPLRMAAENGHIAIVRLLLERGANPNQPEPGIAAHGSALHTACAKGHFEIAKLLLDHGADPNAQVDSSGNCMSIAGKNEKITNLLAAHGGTLGVEIAAYYGELPILSAIFNANPAAANDAAGLYYAAEEGHFDAVKLFVQFAPNLPQRVQAHHAKSDEILDYLFAHRLDPNFATWLGVTSLHRLAWDGNISRAAIYLKHGAKLNPVDDEFRQTPLGWAQRNNKTEMADFLRSHGPRQKELPVKPICEIA